MGPRDFLNTDLSKAEQFLTWLSEADSIDLDRHDWIDIWALVAIAARARSEEHPIAVGGSGLGGATRFAHAVGFRALLDQTDHRGRADPSRTVQFAEVQRFEVVEQLARDLSRLLLPDPEQREVSRTIHYVLVELLRNVVQHSLAKRGGVVAAHLLNGGDYASDPRVQIAVADDGIGIPASLQERHPKLTSVEEALDKSLWPHVSTSFDEGLTGSRQNAGMGLFFISEMAKLTAGTLLVATRGATLRLSGDPDDPLKHEKRMLKTQYRGTLVAFEIPLRTSPQDYEGLIQTIVARAKERTPKRAINRWFSFEKPPEGALRIQLTVAAEDTKAAEAYSEQVLQPAVLKGRPIALTFSQPEVATQSYLHALLFEVVRLAWAKRTPIHIEGATPAVRSSLDLLEQYALGG